LVWVNADRASRAKLYAQFTVVEQRKFIQVRMSEAQRFCMPALAAQYDEELRAFDKAFALLADYRFEDSGCLEACPTNSIIRTEFGGVTTRMPSLDVNGAHPPGRPPISLGLERPRDRRRGQRPPRNLRGTERADLRVEGFDVQFDEGVRRVNRQAGGARAPRWSGD